jgi:hypothetical protein
MCCLESTDTKLLIDEKTVFHPTNKLQQNKEISKNIVFMCMCTLNTGSRPTQGFVSSDLL